MSHSLLALLGFAGWTLTLLLGIVILRGVLTVTGKRAVNRFSPTGDDVSPFSARLVRAHANCYENLPVFAGLVLVAAVSGHSAITDGLACVVLGARVAQSLIHLASTSVPAVMARFSCLAVQIGIEVYWVIELARAGLPCSAT